MNRPNPTRLTSLALSSILLVAGLVAFADPASAHYCKSGDHQSCDSHWCPDDGRRHVHTHDVRWWPDHGCSSGPSSEGGGVEWDLPDVPVPSLLLLEEVDNALNEILASLTDGLPAAAVQADLDALEARVQLELQLGDPLAGGELFPGPAGEDPSRPGLSPLP